MTEDDLVPRIYLPHELTKDPRPPSHYATEIHYALCIGHIDPQRLSRAGLTMEPADAMQLITEHLNSLGLRGNGPGYFHGDGNSGPVTIAATLQRLAVILPWLRSVVSHATVHKIELLEDIFFYYAPGSEATDLQ